MKAVIINGAGQPPVYGEFSDPKANSHETVVKVRAAALSPLTKSRAAGTHYSSAQTFPFIPGVDGTGVLETGESVYFVSFDPPWGSMAEKTLVSSRAIVPLPEGLDPVMAAAIANPGMSSWAALTRRAYLRPGETVLINGATGIAGSLAVRIARHLGAGQIIATGRNIEALNALKSAGADIVVTLNDLPDELPGLMYDGIDIVLDYLWGESALQIMNSANAGGSRVMRFIQIGSVSTQEITLHSKHLRSSGMIIMGSGLGSVPNSELLLSIGELFGAAVGNSLSIPVYECPLSHINSVWDSNDRGFRTVLTVE